MSDLLAAMNRACTELPDGWQVIISLEKGAGWAELYNADGAKMEPQLDDLGLDEQIEACITFATGNSQSEQTAEAADPAPVAEDVRRKETKNG